MDSSERLARLGNEAASRVQGGMLLGLGTGSTAAAMVNALGERVRGGLSVTAVATSHYIAELATSLGIRLKELTDIDRLDLCIDGADEIDPALNLVKGRGGALLVEKLVARRADWYIIIATNEKLVDTLGTRMPLPVEIVPTGWTHTVEAIDGLGLRARLRRQEDQSPFVTDGGHFIVDCDWPQTNEVDAASLAGALKALTGVVDHGLFINMADLALTVDEAGEFTEHRRK